VLARFAKAAGAGEMLNIHDLKAAYEKAIGHETSKSTIYNLLARHRSSQSTLLEAVRQRIKKRRGGCRSNLRSSVASDHAFCAGQIDAWRVRGCFATRRLALRRTSARCHFGCQIIGSRMGDLQRRRTMSWWQCAIYTRKSTEHNLDLTSLLSG
jgi:hypothetical protein